MHVKAELIFRYENEEIAQNIQHAIKIDDGIFVHSMVKQNKINATIENDSLSSILQTIDDYLCCLSVAETIIEKNQKKNNKPRSYE